MDELNAPGITNDNAYQDSNKANKINQNKSANAKWRASLKRCYETLRTLTFVTRYQDVSSRRQHTKAMTLKCSKKHIIFLENGLQSLLDEKVIFDEIVNSHLDYRIESYKNRFVDYLKKEKIRRHLKRKQKRREAAIRHKKLLQITASKIASLTDIMHDSRFDERPLKMYNYSTPSQASLQHIDFKNNNPSSENLISLPCHFRKELNTQLSRSKHSASSIQENDLSSFQDMSWIQSDVSQAPYTPYIHHFPQDTSYMYETEFPDPNNFTSFDMQENVFQYSYPMSTSSLSSPTLEYEKTDSDHAVNFDSFHNWLFSDPEKFSSPVYKKDIRQSWTNSEMKPKLLERSQYHTKKQNRLKCRRNLQQCYLNYPVTKNPKVSDFDGYMQFYKDTVSHLEGFFPAEDILSKTMSKRINKIWHKLKEDEKETYMAMALIEASHNDSLARLSDDLEDVSVVPISLVTGNDTASDQALVPFFSKCTPTSKQESEMEKAMRKDSTSAFRKAEIKTEIEDLQENVFESPRLDFPLLDEIDLSELERELNISFENFNLNSSNNLQSTDYFQEIPENISFHGETEIGFPEETFSDVQLVPSLKSPYNQPYKEADSWQVVPDCDLTDFDDTSLF